MASYPTLSDVPSYPLVEQVKDSVIRSDFDGGYVQTRARHTRIRKTWQIKYGNLTSADKITLAAFVTTVQGGADSFTWVNPQDSVSYEVRFSQPPTFSLVYTDRWNVSFSLEQV